MIPHKRELSRISCVSKFELECMEVMLEIVRAVRKSEKSCTMKSISDDMRAHLQQRCYQVNGNIVSW